MQELLDKCHPLGMFDSIATLAVAQNMRELYRLVLVDTPLAPYFAETLTSEDLDEMNIEIMRNTLYKAYLDDFAAFCQKLGGTTAEVMGELLVLRGAGAVSLAATFTGPSHKGATDQYAFRCVVQGMP